MKMNPKSILFVWMLLCASIVFHSCKDGEEKNDDTPIDEKVEQVYQEIKTSADAILLSEDPVAEFEAIAEQYRAKEEVQSVEVKEDGMFVKFVNDELCGWYIPPVILPSSGKIAASQPSVKKILSTQSSDNPNVGKSACLLNQQVDDSKAWMEYNEYCLSALSQEFYTHNWSVDIVSGKDVNLEFIRRNLKNYDAIYYIAHGCEADGKTWIFTGEKVEKDPLCLPGEVARISLLQKDIASSKVAWHETYAFCGEFIKHYYEKDAFLGTCIYTVACQSLGSHGEKNYSMASAFSDHGGGVYVGWYESNVSGQEAGLHLYKQLLRGMTLSETYSYLENFPPEDRLAATHPEWGSNAGVEDLKNMTVDDSYKLPLAWWTKIFEDPIFPSVDIAEPYITYPASTLHYYPSSAGNYTLIDINEISSCSFADGVVRLKKSIPDNTDYRTNSDGTKFYKSALTLEIEAGGVKHESMIEAGGELYTERSKGVTPCMLIDLEKKVISVFSNSKTPANDYGMNGYVYRIDANTKTWQKETVFSRSLLIHHPIEYQ
jgi:hypothetical protein